MQFSEEDYMFTSEAGIRWYLRVDDNGDTHIGASQDPTAILEQNRAMASMDSGWSSDKYMRRAASVPFGLITQWRNEDGIDFFDENCAKEVVRRLNSSEYYMLRSADWKL